MIRQGGFLNMDCCNKWLDGRLAIKQIGKIKKSQNENNIQL